jgi:NADH-quinone oxidoreductase subunit I
VIFNGPAGTTGLLIGMPSPLAELAAFGETPAADPCDWLCPRVPLTIRPSASTVTQNAFPIVISSRHSSYTCLMSIVRNLAGIAKGMSITFREILEPTQVENYPDGKGPLRGAVFEQRFRGAHVLQRDENGLEKCVACFLCAAACPSNCIFIEAAENTEEKRISSSERYAKVYNIDYNRCIFCGYCVEACPTDAITHGHGFELATLNATNLVMRKNDMLVPVESLTAAK